jgi:hypothetical protein
MKSLSLLIGAAYLMVGASSVCLPGTTKTKLDVGEKVWSEDGLGLAWVETTYQSCTNAPCIMTIDGTCPKYWDYKTTLKTGLISSSNVVTTGQTYATNLPVRVQSLQYMKQSNYIIMQVDDPNNQVMSPKTVLVRPDGRTRTLIEAYDTSKVDAGNPFNVPRAEAYASPTGRYYAVASSPGGKPNEPLVPTLVITVYDACTGAALVSNTVKDFKPNLDLGGIIRWVSDNTISFPESNIFAASNEVRVGTWVFDAAAKKSVSTSFSTAADSTGVCYGAPTTSSTVSRNGLGLYTHTPTGALANMVDVGTPYTWSVRQYDFVVTGAVFNCQVASTRGGSDFPSPNIKCNCGPTATSYTTECKFVWSAGCASGDAQVSKSKCKLGWWDFASTGSSYSCAKSNNLNSCSVTVGPSGAGFNADEESIAVDSAPGRDAGAVTVDVVMGVVIGAVVVAVVIGAVVIRKKMIASPDSRV